MSSYPGNKYLEPELYKTGQDLADNECACIGDNQDITRYTCIAPMRDRHGLINSMGFGSPHVNGFPHPLAVRKWG